MRRRTLDKTGLDVSLLGLGCMRLPVGKDGKLDEAEAIRLIRHAIDGGINYVDTAYLYHGGDSETAVGKALRDGYRERVILTTKLPGWKVDRPEDMDRILDEQLAKLQTDYVDYYLVHSLYDDLWQKLDRMDVLRFLDRAKADGRIRHTGFSFHDELPVFETILNSYDWDACQVQYNLLDVHYQAGRAGIRAAGEKGIDVIVMEPLRGGALADKIPADVRAVCSQADAQKSPVEWAFRFVAAESAVKVILSGMSTLAQVDDNLAIFSRIGDTLEDADKGVIEQVQMLYKQKIQVACTACEYCLPCPQGVSIPEIFKLYNNMYLFDDAVRSRDKYKTLIEEGKDQSTCIACGICESKCPQHLSVIEDLVRAHAALTGDD